MKSQISNLKWLLLAIFNFAFLILNCAGQSSAIMTNGTGAITSGPNLTVPGKLTVNGGINGTASNAVNAAFATNAIRKRIWLRMGGPAPESQDGYYQKFTPKPGKGEGAKLLYSFDDGLSWNNILPNGGYVAHQVEANYNIDGFRDTEMFYDTNTHVFYFTTSNPAGWKLLGTLTSPFTNAGVIMSSTNLIDWNPVGSGFIHAPGAGQINVPSIFACPNGTNYLVWANGSSVAVAAPFLDSTYTNIGAFVTLSTGVNGGANNPVIFTDTNNTVHLFIVDGFPFYVDHYSCPVASFPTAMTLVMTNCTGVAGEGLDVFSLGNGVYRLFQDNFGSDPSYSGIVGYADSTTFNWNGQSGTSNIFDASGMFFEQSHVLLDSIGTDVFLKALNKVQSTNVYSVQQTTTNNFAQPNWPQYLADGTNILIDLNKGTNVYVQMTNKTFFTTPSNITPGQTFTLTIAHTNAVITWGSNWFFNAGVTITTNNNNIIDILQCSVARFGNSVVVTSVAEFTPNYNPPNYSQAVIALSLRKLGNWTGPCGMVRRNSDGAITNIGFVNGWVDTNGIVAFCGASVGNWVYWYNQSGNGYDFASFDVSGSKSPAIWTGTLITVTTNNKPILDFTGSKEMQPYFEDAFTLPPTMFVNAVLTRDWSTASGFQGLFSTDTWNQFTGQGLEFNSGASTFHIIGAGYLNSPAANGSYGVQTNGGLHMVSGQIAPVESTVYFDAAEVTTSKSDGYVTNTPSAFKFNVPMFGIGHTLAEGGFNGKLGEFVMFPATSRAQIAGIKADSDAAWSVY